MHENVDVRQNLFPSKQLDSIVFDYNNRICSVEDSLGFSAEHKIVLGFFTSKEDTLMSISASFYLPMYSDSSRFLSYEHFLYGRRVLITDYRPNPVGTSFYLSDDLKKYDSSIDTHPPPIYDGEEIGNVNWKFKVKNNKLILIEKKRGWF